MSNKPSKAPELHKDPTPVDRDPVVNEFARRRHITSPPAPISWRVHLRRRTAIIARWLHIYLSMVSFAIILFFAVTGFTLNHVDLFPGKPKVTESKGEMPHQWLTGDGDKTAIVDHLIQANHVRGTLADFRVDDQQIQVSFKGPSYAADAFIDRTTNRYDVTETSNGTLELLNDLHRGRNTGAAWSIVVDASAILLGLVSLTGLLLIFFIYKKRTAGLLLVLIGAILCWLVYARFVA